ncbi:OmpL47-type beta-barrel domain-containing protein [Cohnella sp.]|uniref:OmpL47-type beta-barrel domain-containing protein n=1 Tax=Cohnella sp. TaxID=1883426 RepID=UPI00356A5EA6
MKKRQATNKFSFLVSLLLLIQVLFPTANLFAAETNNNLLPPSNLSYQLMTPTDVKLTWSAVFGATGYKVYEITDGQLIARGTSTTTSFTINSLPEGTYTYVVSTLSADGESGPCAPITVDIIYPDMTAPTLTYTIQNGNDIVLNWTASPNAQNYNLYQIQADGQATLVKTQTTRAYTIVNSPAGTYKYAVTASNSVYGESPLSAPIEVAVVYPTMTAPGNFTFTLTNVNDVTLNWNVASYATNYNVYQIIDGQKVLISTVTGTTVKFTNQPTGDYVYEVYSYSARFGESPEGSKITVTVGSVTMTAPENLTYKLQNVNDVILTWSTVSYATSYKIYQIIDGQPILKSTVTGTTVTYTNQPAGDYIYEVHSYSDRFGESAEGTQVTFTLGAVIMAPPGNFTYKLQNLNDIVLTWGTAANANSYKIYQISNGQKVLKSTVTGTTITYTNQPAGDYVYEVHSFSTRYGESPEGSQVTLTIEAVIMAAPENFQYKLLNGNDIVLTWDAAANANTYKVYQITDGQKTLKSTVTGTTVTYANQPQGNYTYEVHSFSTRFGESLAGSQVSIPLTFPIMEPPANLIQTVKNATDFTLTWDSSAYATSYKVYQIVNGQKVLKSTVTGLTVTYTGMSPGEYTYEVHSVSTRFGESPVGTQLTMTLDGQTMQAPANPTYSIANGNDVTLKWSTVTYATSYKIYQVVDGQKILKSTITGTTVTYTNQPEGTLNYEVHSVSKILGESPEGAEITFTLVHPKVAAPGNFTYKIQNGNDVVLTWGAVTYGNSYKVYELVDGQKVLKNSVTTLTVTQTNVIGGEHTYIVHAVSNRFGESPEGSQVTFTLDIPIMQAPGSFTKTITNGNDITFKWSAVTYASGYNLYQVIDGQEVLKKTQTGLTVTFANQPEDDYTYVVRSYSTRFGESPEGSELKFTLVWPTMQAPGNFTKTITNGNDITFKWSAVTYASGYNLYQVIDGQEVLKKTQTGLTVTFANQPEDDYTYVVRSYSTRFGESPEGSELKFTLVWPTMQAPGSFTKTIANGNDITLKWNAVTYATAYRVYQVVDGQKVLKSTLTTTTVKYVNMPAGDYSYEVYSYSSRFGESPIGSTLEFPLVWPVVQPPVLTGAVFNANNITLSWPAVTWANEYRIYDLTGGNRQLIYKGTALNFKVYNLSEDTHSYEVTAYNTRFGESVSSNRVTETIVFPVMQPPVAAVKLLSDTSARISWNFVTYANGYNIFELIDGQPVLLTENLNNLSFTVSDLSYKNHEYYVTSYSNSFGESEPSNTVLAKLIIDTEAPVTKAEAPAGWTNQSQIVTLSATDNETGVANTFYALNDGEFTAGTSVTVDKEGVNKVSFYSVDKVGNTEAVQTISVKIDLTLPSTKVSEIPAWFTQTAVLDLTATDAHSGVAKTYYSVNGSDYVEGNSITVDIEGASEVSFYSVDQAGNKEPAHSVEVKIDRSAPVTSSNASEAWSIEKADVTLTAVDTQSGVAKTYYSVNGSDYVEGTAFTVENEGISKISFYSVDQAGNKETAHSVEVKIDRTAPITVSEAPTAWVKEAVVHLTATDAHSGVAKTYYSVNGTEYAEGQSITVDNEGVNKVSFYSVDQAGNKETAQTIEVKIDRTAPITVSNVPLTWTKEDVAVQLTATDTLSGTAKTFYSINGSEYTEGISFNVSAEGIHKVSFYSIDSAGNIENVSAVEVKIDKTAPVITMNLNEEYKAGTTLLLSYSAIDMLSGILTEKMTVTLPNGATVDAVQNSGIVLEKPGVYTVTVIVTDAVGLSTTLTKQFVVYLQASITVTPNVIKGNKGVFTVRVDLPNGYSTQGFNLDTATLNGVKALNSNNGYYNQAKLGQFKFERSDFNWTTPEVTVHFRGYVDGILVIGEKTVKTQK